MGVPGFESGVPEVLLADLFEHLEDGVYAVDPERRIIYWNKASERITGWAASEIMGRRCLDNTPDPIDDAGCSPAPGISPRRSRPRLSPFAFSGGARWLLGGRGDHPDGGTAEGVVGQEFQQVGFGQGARE